MSEPKKPSDERLAMERRNSKLNDYLLCEVTITEMLDHIDFRAAELATLDDDLSKHASAILIFQNEAEMLRGENEFLRVTVECCSDACPPDETLSVNERVVVMASELNRLRGVVVKLEKRLQFLDRYTEDNDTHHGVRLAVSLIRSDFNEAAEGGE